MTLGFLYAFGATILWGLVYTLDQKILASISPLMFLFISDIIAALVLLPFVLMDIPSFQATLRADRSIILLAAIALFLGILANLLIFSSITMIGASTASMIEIAYPLAVVVFSYLLYRAVPNTGAVLGGLLIFAGSAIIAYFGH